MTVNICEGSFESCGECLVTNDIIILKYSRKVSRTVYFGLVAGWSQKKYLGTKLKRVKCARSKFCETFLFMDDEQLLYWNNYRHYL